MTIELIRSPLLNKHNNISHGFFTRKGGASKGIYESLNFGFGSDDDKKTILQNYKLAAQYLNISHHNIITLKQTHSNIVINFNQTQKLLPRYKEGDALITNIKNFALAVLTADCVPILIYASDINYIAAIHAGWKGAFSGIIENTITALESHGAKTKNMTAAILPSICQESYEVDSSFYQNFITSDPNNAQYFSTSNKDNFLFNLRSYTQHKLQASNIKNIDDIAIDTYKNPDICYSYRRSTHKKEADMGRHISFILLKDII